MKKSWSLAIVAAVLLSGCGAAPTAPIASNADATESEASRLLDKITASTAWDAKKGRTYVAFTTLTLTGKKFEDDRLHYSTDGGKTAAISQLWLGKDGHLYIERPTATPRVYTFHNVGTYKAGKPFTYKFVGGAKLKSRRGIPVPMFDYDYVIVSLSGLPAAEKAEPTWAKL
ncbi:MAG: hypothetical protein ACK46X_15480 [Candidatus Sericytochromatia bacterium]